MAVPDPQADSYSISTILILASVSLICVYLTLRILLGTHLEYYTKMVLFYFAMTTSAVIPIFTCMIYGRHGSRMKPVIWSLQTLNALVFGVKYEIRGRENLLKSSSAVVISNHQSSIDLMTMAEIDYFDGVNVSAKRSLLYTTGMFGLMLYSFGTLFIDRGHPSKAKQQLKNTADEMKKRKLKPYMFPEGTRNPTDTLLPFKKGSFHLAVEAQVPISPIVITSYKHFYDKKNRKFTPGRVIVTCLPQIPTEGMTSDDVTDLAFSVRETMMEVYKKTNAEIATFVSS